MEATRRDVLRWLAATAAGAAASEATRRIAWALEQRAGAAPLVWLNDHGDALNLLTQLGRSVPTFTSLVAVDWDVAEFDALAPAGADPLPADDETTAIVILESLPAPGAWREPAGQRLARLLEAARAAILLGTEACYGGLGNAKESVREVERLCKAGKTPLIKLPGVPTPPQHLVGVLGHLEFFGFPRLDVLRRPLLYYGDTVCATCEYRGGLETGEFARRLGERGCLFQLGCKGPITRNSCSRARWNEGESWCVAAGGPCTGCSEPGYPDHQGLGLYGRLPAEAGAARSGWLQRGERLGYGLLGLTALGLGLHHLRRAVGEDRQAPSSQRR
ncbi:MAG: hypothetical protein HY423_13830 [Candidatus Lambdaproteobacteria bacterium]|nr:hypothetical protein [Candidatus Lambdaproteobacteria bacterium]